MVWVPVLCQCSLTKHTILAPGPSGPCIAGFNGALFLPINAALIPFGCQALRSWLVPIKTTGYDSHDNDRRMQFCHVHSTVMTSKVSRANILLEFHYKGHWPQVQLFIPTCSSCSHQFQTDKHWSATILFHIPRSLRRGSQVRRQTAYVYPGSNPVQRYVQCEQHLCSQIQFRDSTWGTTCT